MSLLRPGLIDRGLQGVSGEAKKALYAIPERCPQLLRPNY
jgi:hypothetical protein